MNDKKHEQIDLVDINENEAMEEGVHRTSATTSSSSNTSIEGSQTLSPKKLNRDGQNRLSDTSKLYDLEGKGKLDEAQQAMRDMDGSNRGFLSNDKVYKIVQEQFELQKSLFKTKRVLLFLTIFIVILALCNLATAFAAATLAKETEVKKDGDSALLVSSSNGNVVATNTHVRDFAVANRKTSRSTIAEGRRVQEYTATATLSAITKTVAADIYSVCPQEAYLDRTTPAGDIQKIHLCPAHQMILSGTSEDRTHTYTYTLSNDETLTITCYKNSENCQMTGDALLLPPGAKCLQDDECEGASCNNGGRCVGKKEDEIDLIVRYKNNAGKQNIKSLAVNGQLKKEINRLHTAAVRMQRGNIQNLLNDENVESYAPDSIVSVPPNEDVVDPSSVSSERRNLAEDQPYGLAMVQADQVSQGSTSIKVCVVDTGYDLGHEDLPTSGHGVTGTSTTVGDWNSDGNGHGTHCAGTIGAIGSNGMGVNSVNPDPSKFTFHIGKGLSDSGTGSTASVLSAVDGCIAAGAKVISMSLGGSGSSSTVEQAYNDAYDLGVLIIAAAGNSYDSTYSYPASYPAVMSVAAVGSNENIASFSTYNSQTEIAGPGVSVKSTIPDNRYTSYSGTSMATPHVAGVAALVWSHFPTCTNYQIRNVLIKTAKDKGTSGCDVNYGFGIVQAKAAYDLLVAEGCEAGGVTLETPSEVAFGGCDQDPDATPSPTAAPTPFSCPTETGEIFTLELTTDNYPGETSWEVTDMSGGQVAMGNGYSDSGTTYTETRCLPSDSCTFKIADSYGDGICCSYGSGSYAISFNGFSYTGVGDFGSSETIDMCADSTLKRDGEDYVYVLNPEEVNFCGHNTHRAPKCGGTLASIINQEEFDMVLTATSITGKNVWIGGIQDDESRSNSGAESNVVWKWSDGSEWFDNDGNYWDVGQPDNNINSGKGQHHVMLMKTGKFKDENGCSGIAKKKAGVYMVPTNYGDNTKYPECTFNLIRL